MSAGSQDVPKDQGNSLYAALARTMTRSLALYFSRPVRLFRPPKVSGWASLRGLAARDGASLSPQYISSLVKQQGISVIPRHFIPPLAINAVLGMVLWASYAETSSFLEGKLPMHPVVISGISGGVAGGVQALAAAPAENVRLVLEGASTHSGWSGAWKDVFLGGQPNRLHSGFQLRREARQVRAWTKEVSEMAGRGWDGWGWGCAKDICGFAAFFSIFEITRRAAASIKKASVQLINDYTPTSRKESSVKAHIPRVVHGLSLVSGGVCAGLAYEFVGRPWDIARRAVYLHGKSVADSSNTSTSTIRILSQKLRTDGILSFFRSTSLAPKPDTLHNKSSRRIHTVLRTLARVGPWGIGFLVWESFGPGLAM